MTTRRPRRRRARAPVPVMTREEFIERFARWFEAQDWSYREGEEMSKRLGAQIHDTVFELIDRCVMPPTDAWMRDLVQKLEAL